MPECFAYKSHLAIDINGYRIPCCMYRSIGDDDPLVSNHWTKMTFNEYRNLPEYQNLKNTMEKGNWHKGCRACKNQEDLGIGSLRIGNNRSIKHKKNDNNDVEFIEISLGNDCNLSCRMCAPNFSTDYIKRIENNKKLLKFIDFGSLDCKRISYSVEEMFDPVDLSKLKIIKYIGGEPFITPQIGKLFEYLHNKVDLSNIKLFTNTNASFYPEKYIHYLKQFEQVSMCVSIDGIGRRDEYIREGTHWETKVKNINKYIKQGFDVSGHTVLSALNVDQVPLLEKFGEKYFGGRPPHFTICTSPEHLTLNALPPKYVQNISKFHPSIEKYFLDYKFDKKKSNRLKKFIREFDKTTNKSLQNYIPLLSKHLT